MDEVKLNIKVVNAKTFWHRFTGFMFKNNVEYALMFKNCRSVHTFFMRFDLDIVYLDKDNRVVKIKKHLKPFRIALPIEKAVSVLEIPSNTLENIDFMLGKKLVGFF